MPGRGPAVPAEVASVVRESEEWGEAGDERLLGAAADGAGTTVVVGRHRLWVVVSRPDDAPPGAVGPDDALPGEAGPGDIEPHDRARVVVSRPWHLVDSGTWSGADLALRVTWVDGATPVRVTLPEPGPLPELFRERVQSSVVYGETVDLGERRTARVVVRRDLATGALLAQTVLGRGVRSTDPGVPERVAAGLARVREQVGLD
ncbi:MAG: hypothetical protein ACRCYR_04825 [Phycicoccus sp.]